MAVACGLCAGANYLNQPLLHSIAQSFGISDGTASVLVTCAQVSYALGLLFLVPLGDMLERRRLVVTLMGVAALGLLLSAASPRLPGQFTWLVLGTLLTGLFSVAAQVLVPMASLLASPAHAGRAVGFVMGGLLTGILLARTVAGVLSGIGGWSLSYWVTGAVMLAVAAVLAGVLPRSRSTAGLSYAQVLGSMWQLLTTQPRLRSRTLLGGFSFGSVSVLFSTMALLLGGPAHGLSDATIGLIGLAGVTGALMANLAGRLIDRGHATATTAAGVALLLLSWLPLWWGQQSVWIFIAGMLLIDLALQAVHICNQGVIYALAPQARSRINAVYMTGYFVGASTGSAVGAMAWLHGGWTGACLAGLGFGLCNLAALLHDRTLARSAP
ncbi:MFS transporter [Comamonas serinivorans]|uniref:MFS transporter n=2 Tax=Comamonas serinivorans TaxID=1082851 RepID=A0A1Y0ESB5_9BURK|nr:MFS transporter [Comamonas serinivorans]